MSRQKNSKKEKIRLAVLFGGRSVEHEISIITGLQAMQAMDPEKYSIIPIYIAPTGKWFTGKPLYNRPFYRTFDASHPEIQEVTLLPKPDVQGLLVCKNGIPTQEKIAIDACFLGFHGQQGEDGCIQGLLEMTDIPYTGCGVPAAAVSMNKFLCKAIVKAAGVPVLPGIKVSKEDAMQSLAAVCRQIQSTPGLENFPLFVKPCSLGSSVGVSPALDLYALHGALAKVFQYDDYAIVEPFIQNLLEVNISILDGTPVKASVTEIPLTSRETGALSYDDKYMRGGNKLAKPSQGMASLARIINPDHLPLTVKAAITQYALDAFKAIGCSGQARLDFMIDTSKDQIYFNEINPIPGSLAFYLWDRLDPPLLYTQSIDQMIARAFEKKAMKLSLKDHIGFRAL